MAAKKKPKVLFWGARRSKTTGGWKAVIFTSEGKYYMNHAFHHGSKSDHEDIAGGNVAQMLRTLKFRGYKAKKIR